MTLTKGILPNNECKRFLKDVQNLRELKSGHLKKLNLEVNISKVKRNLKRGIF